MATAGPNSPGTLANDNSFGTAAWSNPGNAASSNNSYASVVLTSTNSSQYLKATNFSFSIPGGSTIDGILVDIERSADSGVTIRDTRVRLVKGGAVGSTDKAATGTSWPGADATASYGSSSDLWGDTWTDSDINASNFGVVVACTTPSGGSGINAFVDHIRITITYTAGGGGQPMALRQSQIRTGFATVGRGF